MNYLRAKIDAKGLKISWLAKQIDVHQPVLSMYLRGKRTISEDKEKKLKEILA
mgnify:CR=1 FL=1